jgi:hypothetical protein
MYSVARNDITSETNSNGITMPSFWQRPKQIYLPELGLKEAVQHVQDMLTKGVPDIHYQMARYLPMEDHSKVILDHSMDMKKYLEKEKSISQLKSFWNAWVVPKMITSFTRWSMVRLNPLLVSVVKT